MIARLVALLAVLGVLGGCSMVARLKPVRSTSAAVKPTPVSVVRTGERDVIAAGARPDGQTDNTTIFQGLLDEAARQGGGRVFVPAGQYAIRGTLRIPANVTLEGVSQYAPAVGDAGDPKTATKTSFGGSVLLAYAGRGARKGQPFILLAGHNAVLKGITVYYPEWQRSAVPPVPYPPCIAGAPNIENLAILDCQLVNPYEAIRLEQSHRFLIRNVMGYPIRRGLYINNCTDIGRIENIHFWPFNIYYEAGDPYCLWINQNGVAFEFGRTDWQYVSNTFCFGYGVGYKFVDAGQGGANGNFLGFFERICG